MASSALDFVFSRTSLSHCSKKMFAIQQFVPPIPFIHQVNAATTEKVFYAEGF
jgi:hypothetical protein